MPYPTNGEIADYLTENIPDGQDIVFQRLLSVDADLVDTLYVEDEK